METAVRGRSSEVIIGKGNPVRIIGESINPTRRRRLEETLKEGDFSYMLELAALQAEAGADILDVNVGFPGVDDARLLPEAVKAIQESFDIPLSIDSPNPLAIEAALKVAEGIPVINSATGEDASMNRLLPMAREHGAALICLLMDDKGIPASAEDRFAVAERIAEQAVRSGVSEDKLIFDPLVTAVSADPSAALVSLETMSLVSKRLGFNITMGASNISFGLPDREVLNTVFLALAISKGLTCPIANPAGATAAIRAADLLLGADDYAMRFIEQYQARISRTR